MDVAIFGAGISGLMTAITLRSQGHQCHVYERSRQSQDAGMGFILVPEGIACLESFGVYLTGACSGSELEGYSCREASGDIVFEEAMPRGSKGVRRRDLTAALINALGDDAVVYAELRDLEVSGEFQVKAAAFRSASDRIRKSADLFVSAEGVNSRARQVMFPDWPTMPDRVHEIVGLVRCDKAVQWAGKRLNKFHASEGGIALGILPVDKEHVVWYMQFDSQRYSLPAAALRSEDEARARARHAFVEKLVGTWGHPVPSLLANTDFARVHLWRPVDTDLIPQFHRGNLALVGDAAHPLSPFTSQGVASAVADAVALAEEMDEVASSGELEKALARYSQRRHRECAPYLAKGRQLSANFLEPLTENSAVLPIALKVSKGEDARPGF
ncbi:MAG TPA: NAD(P)/FAD-dependent oxidoreductase [Candidatus Angelobacter sp.]|nr:NAD(P)/FAD-dependent oxidoreductase [Candidatus Angelobacter sp.]